MADETIRIDGDASDALSAIRATRAALRGLATDAVAASKAESSAAKTRADNINAWKRAASGVAPAFTGALDSMEEFWEGAEKVGVASMKSRVAVLALASGATAAAAAVVAAGAAIVASSIDVIANLENYNDVATRHRAKLEDAAAAYAGMNQQVRELRVELAGQLAPALQGTFDVIGLGIEATRQGAAAFGLMTDAIGGTSAALGYIGRAMPGILGTFLQAAGIAGRVGALVSMFRREQEAARGGLTFDMQAEAAAQASAQAEADAMMLVESTRAATASIAVHTTAARQQTEALAATEMATWDLAAEMRAMADAQNRLAQNATARSASIAANIGAGAPGLGGQNGKGPMQDANVSANAARATSDAWTSAFGQIASSAAQAATAIIAMSAQSTDQQIGDASRLSATQRREMREHFRRQKEAAIATALINGALAFTSALSTPPIYVGIAMAALSAVLTGIQVAAIARQQPSFHRGGVMAPDEAQMTARIRRDEQLMVVPARGGPTAQDVARMATGEGSKPADPIVYVVDDSGSRRRTRRHAGASPGYGRLRLAAA